MNKLTKIDGLGGFRGILVLSVIVFHAFLVFSPEDLSQFSGGFLAVESFFCVVRFFDHKVVDSKE